MLKHLRLTILGLLLGTLGTIPGYAEEEYTQQGTEKCVSCHDFGSESPVHAVLAGAHGNPDDKNTPMGQRGCEDCHGPSASHTRAPTQVSPGISFGPRWSATIADQDKQCLACHEENVAGHWRDALHMVNDLTCVTCHDVHQDQDKVLQASGQAQVCTVCHKSQKSGMHAMANHQQENPVCSSCHNPHDAQSAVGSMLENRSQGCRACHDIVAMNTSAAVPEKAISYHKVMAQPDRTCLDCHQGIAHGTAAGVAASVIEPARSRTVTLFKPGQSDSEWLLTEHPGSQPLRQGRNCQQCHRGEEAQMAAALSADSSPDLRELAITFARDTNNLLLTMSWKGSADDADIALMWGDHGSDAFRRGGCFAACHSDMPGMSRDRGQQLGKYLLASRAQQQRIGQPAILKDQAERNEMLAAGNYAEMWRVKLNGGDVSIASATVLSELSWSKTSALSGGATFADGRCWVKLKRPLAAGPGHKDFTPEGKYTLGIALHGDRNPGGQHWVSLPMSFSLGGDDTDFTTQ
jgi:DmsE family decaheme c-type cytochrome